MRLLTEALVGLHYNLGQIEKDVWLSAESSTEAIDRHAEARFGNDGRKGATIASGTDALTVYGTGTFIAGDELVSSDGTRYQLTTGGTASAAGVAASVESIDRGTVANRDGGETLTFSSPAAGITAEADIVAAIGGAEDQESDGDLVARILDAYRNPPAGGRFSDYRQWATGVEGVLSAYCYGPSSQALTGRRGLGTVDVAILSSGSGLERIPTITEQTAVEDAINLVRPATVRDFQVLLPTTYAVDVFAEISPKYGYEFDWTRLVACTVTTWVAGTLTVNCSQNIVDFAPSMVAGDRVLLADEVVTVATIGTASFTVTAAPTITPAPGDTIHPAGPLTAPLKIALQAMFDELGPARGTASDPEQDWDDTVRLSSIIDTIMSVDGVKDVVLLTPVINQTPVDDGTDVELFIAGVLYVYPTI